MEIEYLSKPIQIGKKTAANRFVVLPNESNDGLDSGAPSERSLARYKKYVEGQAGIVFSESVLADIGGRARIHQLYLGKNTVDGFARMIDELRKVNPEVVYIIQVDLCFPVGKQARLEITVCSQTKSVAPLTWQRPVKGMRVF